jgi:outer membrane protein assembly factor BamB
VRLRNGRLVAVALASGAIEWSVDAPTAPGLAAGDGLVFVSAPAAIEARAAADGSVRWRAPIDGDVTGGLVWDQGWLLAVTSRGTAIAIRARDGQTIWQQPAGAPASAAPTLGGDRAYLVLDDGRVQARRLLTGDLVWERKLGGRPAQLLPLDDRLFVGSQDRFFYCLATKDGAVKWRWRAGGDVIGAPVVDETAVYFVALDNVLRALNRGNGHQRWRQLLATRPTGGPLRFERNVLLVAGIAAEMWAYRAKDGALAGEVGTPAELAAPPLVVSAGNPLRPMVIVVTMEGHIQGMGLAPIGHPVKGLPLYMPLPPTPPASPGVSDVRLLP